MSKKTPLRLVTESDDSFVKATFERLASKSTGIVNIHRAVANSPKVFAAFIGLAHALRFETELGPAERELAILCVLERHGGHYELVHHRKMAAAAGLGEPQIANVRKADAAGVYSERQLRILQFAERFAADAADRKALADPRIEELLDDRSRLELAMTLALYVGLAHLTGVLDIPED